VNCKASSTQSLRGKSLPLVWILPVVAAGLPILWGVGWKDWLWWAALIAPCAGSLGAHSLRIWRRAGVALVWCAAWFWLGRGLEVVDRLGGLGALLGLLCMGGLLGGLVGPRTAGRNAPFAGALLALGLSLLLIGLPAGFWLFSDPPWSPEIAARLLDCSPATLMLETAGVDYLRLPAIYGPVGADSMDPNLRLPWGNLAGWGVCVLGLCLSMAGSAWRRRNKVPKRNS
jgi:hypothetical protein